MENKALTTISTDYKTGEARLKHYLNVNNSAGPQIDLPLTASDLLQLQGDIHNAIRNKVVTDTMRKSEHLEDEEKSVGQLADDLMGQVEDSKAMRLRHERISALRLGADMLYADDPISSGKLTDLANDLADK